jgi:hypothetical protein
MLNQTPNMIIILIVHLCCCWCGMEPQHANHHGIALPLIDKSSFPCNCCTMQNYENLLKRIVTGHVITAKFCPCYCEMMLGTSNKQQNKSVLIKFNTNIIPQTLQVFHISSMF